MRKPIKTNAYGLGNCPACTCPTNQETPEPTQRWWRDELRSRFGMIHGEDSKLATFIREVELRAVEETKANIAERIKRAFPDTKGVSSDILEMVWRT